MKELSYSIPIGFIIMLFTLTGACTSGGVFSAKGTVSTIVRGKDGYTATLTNKDGQQFDAVISRVNLAKTAAYQELTVGEKITVYGDTNRIGDRISIKVNQIKK